MDHEFIRLSRINNLNKSWCFKAPGVTSQCCWLPADCYGINEFVTESLWY